MQTEPVSSRALEAVERAHDAFDRSIADHVLTGPEIVEVQWALDLAVWSASIANIAREIGVNVQRGGPQGDRFGRLMAAWREYEERGVPMPPQPVMTPIVLDQVQAA